MRMQLITNQWLDLLICKEHRNYSFYWIIYVAISGSNLFVVILFQSTSTYFTLIWAGKVLHPILKTEMWLHVESELSLAGVLGVL